MCLTVNEVFILDLQDDFKMNYTKDLYEFINGDIIKAYYLGLKFSEWYKDLESEQQYLYSKQARHNKDFISKYSSQIDFWINRFAKDNNMSDEDGLPVLDVCEYVLNNMIYDNDSDDVKLAFHLGYGTNCIH